MLGYLSRLAIRTTGCCFPLSLREMFREHLPQVAMKQDAVYAPADGKDTSSTTLMRQPCGDEPMSDVDMRE